jgi:hypothetical protein
MEVHLEGNVILRQDEAKTPGKGDQRTIRAHELDYNFVSGRLVAINVEGHGPGGTRFVASRLEYSRAAPQPARSLASSEHREFRAGDAPSQKPTGRPGTAAKTKGSNTSDR